MSATLKLTVEDVGFLIEKYLALLAIAEADRERAESAIAHLRERIRLFQLAVVPDGSAPFPVPVSIPDNPLAIFEDVFSATHATPLGARTEKGRVPHGQTRILVENFLRSRNGAGATTNETVIATGTKYPTVRRILKELKESNMAFEGGHSIWHWGPRPGSAENPLPACRVRTRQPKTDLQERNETTEGSRP
jgi:hypothetical protein